MTKETIEMLRSLGVKRAKINGDEVEFFADPPPPPTDSASSTIPAAAPDEFEGHEAALEQLGKRRFIQKGAS